MKHNVKVYMWHLSLHVWYFGSMNQKLKILRDIVICENFSKDVT